MEENETKRHVYVPDARDLAIVKCICDSARLSYSEIGKLTRISKDRVRERINVLEKELFILSFVPLIDYKKIGYRLFHVYIQTHKSLDRKSPVIKATHNSPQVIALTRLAGKWDLEIQILAKNKGEISNQLEKIGIKEFSSQLEILEAREIYLYSMRVESNVNSPMYKSNSIYHTPLDDIDYHILELLSINARAKVIDLADSCKVSEDVIRYRIKSLIKSGVILGFYARTNKHRFGLTSYILELSLSSLSDNQADSLKKLQNIYYIRSFKGKRNLIINFSAKDNAQLVETLDYIKDIAGKNLESFDLSLLLDRYKFIPFSIRKPY